MALLFPSLSGLNSKVLEAYSCIINCAASTDSLNDEPNNLSLQILVSWIYGFVVYLSIPSKQHYVRTNGCRRCFAQGSKFDRHSLQTNLGAVTRFAKDKLDDGKTILILCSDGDAFTFP